MQPDTRNPLKGEQLNKDMTVFDLVYTPPVTPLIEAARARGCATITGLEMFIEQAREQFYLFFPVLLVVLWRVRFSLWLAIAGMIILSFAANLYWMGVDAAGAFFLPHTRFWELLAGGLLAYGEVFKIGFRLFSGRGAVAAAARSGRNGCASGATRSGRNVRTAAALRACGLP
mgnify:CR=1 FL=1